MLAAMGLRVWAPVAESRGAPAGRGEAAAHAAEAEAEAEADVDEATVAVAHAPQVATAPPERAIRHQAIAAMDWQALRQAVADCTACGLCATRRQTVFGVGHPHAQWMIVGEAPGEQEDLKGEPFVGAAGQLLDQMLRALGLSRTAELPAVFPPQSPARDAPSTDVSGDADGDPSRRVFIANTLKCRPPRNRNPEPDELALCEPFLRRQVELVRPRLILLMGRFAVKTLLKSDEAIGRLRGRLHRYEGIPVVVTYHPAYLLRNLPDKARSWADLCFAARTMDELRATSPASSAASTPDS
jgi:DNA polymerase